MQLALQRLEPGESVERHHSQEQFVRVEHGALRVLIYSEDSDETLLYSLVLETGGTDTAIIPAGAWHQLSNTGCAGAVLFYTIYAPPAH